jgi:hypothetical protein
MLRDRLPGHVEPLAQLAKASGRSSGAADPATAGGLHRPKRETQHVIHANNMELRKSIVWHDANRIG